MEPEAETVILFSHGACSGKFAASYLLRILALQGFTTYSIDHLGGNAMYTEDKEGNPVKFSAGKGRFDNEHKKISMD